MSAPGDRVMRGFFKGTIGILCLSFFRVDVVDASSSKALLRFLLLSSKLSASTCNSGQSTLDHWCRGGTNWICCILVLRTFCHEVSRLATVVADSLPILN